MIDIKQYDWWGHDFDDPEAQRIEVFDLPRERLSEVLGPDGNQLRIVSHRRIGFDLRPRGAGGSA